MRYALYGKNIRKSEKQSWRKTAKQLKKLFEIDIKTKFCSKENIWQQFCSDSRG